MKKIIKWHPVFSYSMEDYTQIKGSPINETRKGLISIGNELIKQGFVPYGEIQVLRDNLGLIDRYYKEFVKYEE